MLASRIGAGRHRAARVLTVSLMLAGCAGYQLPPLTTFHPAHPDAPAAPGPPRSTTLAYTPSEIPASQPAADSARTEIGARAEATAASTVVGEGEVIATAPGSSQLVVDHEEIKGFMEAMTMGYRVDPPSLLTGLNPGDRVRFTIDVARRAIVRIEKLP